MKSKEEIRRIIESAVREMTGSRPKGLNLTFADIVPQRSYKNKYVSPPKGLGSRYKRSEAKSEVRAFTIRTFADSLQQQVVRSLGEARLVEKVSHQLGRTSVTGKTTLRQFVDVVYEAQSGSTGGRGAGVGSMPGAVRSTLKDRPFKQGVLRIPSGTEVVVERRRTAPIRVTAKKAALKIAMKKAPAKKSAAKRSVLKKSAAKKVVARKATGGGSGSASVTPKKPATVDATVINVFFGTNREKTNGSPLRFGSKRAQDTTLGICHVSIPKSHVFGQLETPASFFGIKQMPDPKKHIMLLKSVTRSERAFLEEVKATVTAGKKELFLFVHGYNVRFENAARVTAQIAYDLQFDGAAVMFSWPSAGRILSYTRDAGRIEPSLPAFKRFLTLLAMECRAERVNIIAHSMGNRLVCNALNELHLAGTAAQSFEHLVLAAPDVPTDRFVQIAGALTHLGKSVTLYQSSRDRAMPASEFVNGEPRAGDPVLIVRRIDTIDASPLGSDLLRHSYFREAYPLLTDIFHVFRGDRPDQRVGIRPELHEGKRYYAFPAIR